MIKNQFNIFNNIKIWQNHKYKTLFRTQKELDYYQKKALENLLLENKKKHEPLFLSSSGTTSNKPKKYKFPKNVYPLIENHHIWKIMHCNNIQKGNVIKILQGGQNYSKDYFVGPKKDLSLGIENDSWELIYNPKFDPAFWKKVFKSIKEIRPKFLYTSPSIFECFYEQVDCKFEFPVIFSCEILTNTVRKKAESFFSKAIDKMRDWTTGFGFFECELGTKHVYDDLCLVEQVKENLIKSTDLFNYCETNPIKLSDDRGLIKKKLCNCGLYGNVVESFEGKFFEHLVSVKNKKYSSNYISDLLGCFDFEILSYEITQDKNKNIIFKTKKPLTDLQVIRIAKNLKNIIVDDGGDLDLYNNNRTIWKSKKSNICFNFQEDSFKIHKNKKISLRNFVVDNN